MPRAIELPRAKLSAFDAVFFDVGDTLLYDKPDRKQRISRALRQCGVQFDPADLTQSLFDLDLAAVAKYIAGESVGSPDFLRSYAQSLVCDLGYEPGEGDIDAVVAAYVAQPYDRVLSQGAKALLGELHDSAIKVGIISDWEADLEEVLDKLGCLVHFDSLSISSVVGVHKPSPLLFQDGLAKLGVAPERSVHVGDYIELDVEGARAAGMQAVLYDSRRRYGQLAGIAPVAHSFADLRAVFADIEEIPRDKHS